MAFSTSGREVFPSARNVNNYYAQRSNKSKSKHTTFVWATEDAVASSVRSILFHGYLSSVFEQTVQRNRRSCRMFLQAQAGEVQSHSWRLRKQLEFSLIILIFFPRKITYSKLQSFLEDCAWVGGGVLIVLIRSCVASAQTLRHN